MKLLLRHKLLIAAVALVAAASAGGAYAAAQSSSNPRQAYLNDVAKRLHVSPARLRSALKAALIDRLNEMVKTGQLTQAQANKIEQRLEKGAPLTFGFPGGFRRGFHAGRAGILNTAASYLGLTQSQLISDLRSGQSLAQVATSRGKSVSGLEAAITAAEKTRLDRLVSSHFLTSAQEQRMLSRLSARIDKLVNQKGFGPMLGYGPMGGPGPKYGPMLGASPMLAPGPPTGASGAGPALGPPPPAA